MFLRWVFSASSLSSLIDRISLIVCGIRASLAPLLEMLNVCTPSICAEKERERERDGWDGTGRSGTERDGTGHGTGRNGEFVRSFVETTKSSPKQSEGGAAGRSGSQTKRQSMHA